MTVSTELASPPWKAPQPRELPEWPMWMVEYTGGDEIMRSLATAITAGQAAVVPTVLGGDASTSAVASVLLARAEKGRLREARLHYATADMTALALAATAPPTEPILPSGCPSLPTSRGSPTSQSDSIRTFTYGTTSPQTADHTLRKSVREDIRPAAGRYPACMTEGMTIVGYAVLNANLIKDQQIRAQLQQIGESDTGRYGALFVYDRDEDGSAKKWTLFTADPDYAEMLTKNTRTEEFDTGMLRAKFPGYQPGWVITEDG
ncbi:hypothetical protein IU447_27595 [Nocardia farcinica]|uniref:hypothetical protein n=1 Tax=Nocardia farcinica TaxID=37329 RepID=UPI001894E73D|nr:hypothetical protein [Nocardia farcinica]MBF6363874.1 hypothetical protein [Nocardia farcinica]